jgi:hypothetical protein
MTGISPSARAGAPRCARRKRHVSTCLSSPDECAAGRTDRVNFSRIASAARPNLSAIVKRWLPDGRRQGKEWVARNPTRSDKNPGSFKINLRTGRWADFATSHIGGDAISLAAYLFGLSQVEAARKLARMLNVRAEGE